MPPPEPVKKEAVVVAARKESLACKLPALVVKLMIDNATNHTSGRTAASFTSTSVVPETSNERVLQDEEECESPMSGCWADDSHV